jgi:hypothetical protein
MPLVTNVPHNQCVIKGDASGGEHLRIGEVTRLDLINGERTNLPAVRFEADSIEATTIRSRGVADAASLKERRRLGDIVKAG